MIDDTFQNMRSSQMFLCNLSSTLHPALLHFIMRY